MIGFTTLCVQVQHYHNTKLSTDLPTYMYINYLTPRNNENSSENTLKKHHNIMHDLIIPTPKKLLLITMGAYLSLYENYR